jgi:hypothetical protein
MAEELPMPKPGLILKKYLNLRNELILLKAASSQTFPQRQRFFRPKSKFASQPSKKFRMTRLGHFSPMYVLGDWAIF